jgi:glucose-6-phosphate 1-dehydrogenase
MRSEYRSNGLPLSNPQSPSSPSSPGAGGWGSAVAWRRQIGHRARVNEPDVLDELLTCRLDRGRKVVEPCTIVIFGASGDLTARKLIPALYHLHREGQLPEPIRVVGVARREKTEAAWRGELRVALEKYARKPAVEEASWAAFAQNLHYCQGDMSEPETHVRLRNRLEEFGPELERRLLFYLAVAPSLFPLVVERLDAAGLLQAGTEEKESWRRVVIEKPFGQDEGSARELNVALMRHAHERQVFRIDHYLGKETVQNIMLFRFSNAIFEEIWNRQSIEHVQITMGEQAGVGSRGAFYEEVGAMRDIVQNHLLQVLALMTMEPPVNLDGESIRDEKVKLLRAIRILDPGQVAINAVRGQYDVGQIGGNSALAYRQEARVNSASNVETYVALRLLIDNWRWSGVPFYLRSGKRLAQSVSEVRIQFRRTPHVLFAAQCGPKLDANSLTLRLQPNEGITLRFNGKVPGGTMEIRPVRMHFSYNTEFGAYTPEAYERLLLEAIAGDPTLFIRRDEVEVSWAIVDPIRAAWSDRSLKESEFYPAGSWGPAPADELLARYGHAWRNPTEPGV